MWTSIEAGSEIETWRTACRSPTKGSMMTWFLRELQNLNYRSRPRSEPSGSSMPVEEYKGAGMVDDDDRCRTWLRETSEQIQGEDVYRRKWVEVVTELESKATAATEEDRDTSHEDARRRAEVDNNGSIHARLQDDRTGRVGMEEQETYEYNPKTTRGRRESYSDSDSDDGSRNSSDRNTSTSTLFATLSNEVLTEVKPVLAKGTSASPMISNLWTQPLRNGRSPLTRAELRSLNTSGEYISRMVAVFREEAAEAAVLAGEIGRDMNDCARLEPDTRQASVYSALEEEAAQEGQQPVSSDSDNQSSFHSGARTHGSGSIANGQASTLDSEEVIATLKRTRSATKQENDTADHATIQSDMIDEHGRRSVSDDSGETANETDQRSIACSYASSIERTLSPVDVSVRSGLPKYDELRPRTLPARLLYRRSREIAEEIVARILTLEDLCQIQDNLERDMTQLVKAQEDNKECARRTFHEVQRLRRKRSLLESRVMMPETIREAEAHSEASDE